MAIIRWRAVISALGHGRLPCSGSEADILRIAASLGAGVPVRLRDVLGILDHANIARVVKPSRWPTTPGPSTPEEPTMIANLQAHYGFSRMPFGRDLAPGMLHRHHAHDEAVARINWCITERSIGVITGEAGAG